MAKMTREQIVTIMRTELRRQAEEDATQDSTGLYYCDDIDKVMIDGTVDLEKLADAILAGA